MSDGSTASEMKLVHNGRCPNGHDVPSSRTSCGVCGAVMEVHPKQIRIEADDEAATPSAVWWLVLIVLGLAALAIPLLREPVLYADDFTTPEALRTWPADGTIAAYENDEYHLTVLSDGAFPFAVQDLPKPVNGLTIEVEARIVDGDRAIIAVDCVSEMIETEGAEPEMVSVEQTAYYTFVVQPGTGTFAIGDRTSVLREGRLPGASDRIVVSCVADGTDTLLRIGAGADAIEIVDEGGLQTFRAISLGANSEVPGDEVAFDDLLVTETRADEVMG